MAKIFIWETPRCTNSYVDLIRRDLINVNADKSMFVWSDKYVANGKEENPLIEALL